MSRSFCCDAHSGFIAHTNLWGRPLLLAGLNVMKQEGGISGELNKVAERGLYKTDQSAVQHPQTARSCDRPVRSPDDALMLQTAWGDQSVRSRQPFRR